MKDTRTPIPDDLKLQVLKMNRHRCCICYQEQVVLHHIDKNPSNNTVSNIAVVCHHHHGLAHAHFDLAQNYTPEVISDYKKDWQTRIANGEPLPAVVAEPSATQLARIYERQQTAYRIVLAQELLENYRQVLERYKLAGGRNAGLSKLTVCKLARLREGRWQTLADLGILQEYIELLARTYVEIDNYNFRLSSPAANRITQAEWADSNLRAGTAITMSLAPLFASLDRTGPDFEGDFADLKYAQEYQIEQSTSASQARTV